MVEINNKTKTKINLELVKRVTEKFLKLNPSRVGKASRAEADKKKNYNVSIAFVGNIAIRKLNKIYRKKDKATDILSFPSTIVSDKNWVDGKNEGEGDFLGEIIINYSQIKRQAKAYKNSAQEELIFILVHGLLHLMGYEDETEDGRRKMERLGSEFIKKTKIY